MVKGITLGFKYRLPVVIKTPLNATPFRCHRFGGEFINCEGVDPNRFSNYVRDHGKASSSHSKDFTRLLARLIIRGASRHVYLEGFFARGFLRTLHSPRLVLSFIQRSTTPRCRSHERPAKGFPAKPSATRFANQTTNRFRLWRTR